MKTIGFVDDYLDEWHANRYPAWIEEASGGRLKVAYAYGRRDADRGLSNAAWCEKNGIALLTSIEEVADKCDGLVVLAPDHPELHEELALPCLRSGKPTYVDKTFAPDRRTAEALFEAARAHGTPVYSASALRFAAEYAEADKTDIEVLCSVGPGDYGNYAVHQLEPIVALMGRDATRLMYIGTPDAPALLITFADGRQATVHQLGRDCPFGIAVRRASGGTKVLKPESDYFRAFIRQLVAFFETGAPGVEPADTIAIVTLLEYGRIAARTPYEWVELPVSG
ncbi:hypothetical protein SAMN02799624_04862 [Paenibacillus sp. UNC496MF]|uniref:Gfo/Idh/MocA family protein n=1 Tax=Paenibacillus sp. UNC496MF TaxID=1502753 RepID=UPI0008E5569C|nr:Gfo/Idh/MocA family oxidoreductase [Paenibacillus sp. UNC496MF]SFJ51889.1 hypothetical protein SAMN02799624_04862 [Paenibacillus sp. UNC496MF]